MGTCILSAPFPLERQIFRRIGSRTCNPPIPKPRSYHQAIAALWAPGNCAKLRTTRGYFGKDLLILSLGRMARTTPESAPPLQTSAPRQWEDIWPDGFSVLQTCLHGGSSMELDGPRWSTGKVSASGPGSKPDSTEDPPCEEYFGTDHVILNRVQMTTTSSALTQLQASMPHQREDV
ncbi:hypothetical protein AVEN_61061-1 [Araneus ventricosus]|uniref:Uncharacterized protein n=1 Tax=Araneus ventricosus TaxID=182803 RepID=A0A4Y2DY43_ARAVE|nr:hypothetical protein AVEN_61061-1 [Araneus ventricosus]